MKNYLENKDYGAQHRGVLWDFLWQLRFKIMDFRLDLIINL